MIISWGSGWLPELTAALIDFLKFTATTAPFHCNLFILSTCIERIKNSKRIKRRARTKSSYSLFQPDPSNVESLHLCLYFFQWPRSLSLVWNWKFIEQDKLDKGCPNLQIMQFLGPRGPLVLPLVECTCARKIWITIYTGIPAS